MLKNWVKIYFYQIKNNKFFTALNILGLSIGIAGLIFSILYWNDEHSYDAWNPEKEKVFLVFNDMGPGNIWNTNVAAIDPHLSTFSELESHCYFRNYYIDEIFEYNGKKELVQNIIIAQKNFFSYFPFEFIKGSPKNALSDESSIAISETLAKRLFGNEDPMGKELSRSGKIVVVRGVYKLEGKSSLEPLAVMDLLSKEIIEKKDSWGDFSYGLLVKLKDPAKIKTVENKIHHLFYVNRTIKWAKAEGLTPEEYVKKNGDITPITSQLKTARLHAVGRGFPDGKGNYQFLLIMSGLSILILVLSVVNYINLATANAMKRAKEVGVRKVLGASKTNIVKQFLFETVISALFAILLALVIVELALPYYNDFLNKALVISGSEFYLQLILTFLIVVIMAGIFPAIYVANFEALNVLKGNFNRSKKGIWMRNGMLILQFGIAFFFIIGSYIVYEQVQYMSTKDLGFKGEQVMDIRYRGDDSLEDPKEIFSHYDMIKQELSKINGVERVSSGAFSLGNSTGSSSSFSYNNVSIQGQNMAIDFEVLDMLQMKIADGRNLSPQFASDTINSILLNETAVRMMNEKNPIGKEISWNDRKLKIVGVVKDFHSYGLQAPIPPMVFLHFKTVDWMSFNLNRVYVKVLPENIEQTIKKIETFWTKKVDTKYAFEYGFVDKNFQKTYESYVKQRNLFGLLNGVVILIALFGLFALASYSIQRRMKEIAIRKTLGAETKTLLKELSKQYIIYCFIGFLIALYPTFYLLEKWLENFAFRIEISSIPFIIGFLLLMVLTLIIVISRAYQATRVNVLKYLKYE